jgi:hypothetical protein
VEEDVVGASSSSLERRFAYNFLEKLLHYLDISSINMKSFVPSANFSRRSSFNETKRDVKFFSKVIGQYLKKKIIFYEVLLRYLNSSGCASTNGKIFQHPSALFHCNCNCRKHKWCCFLERERDGCNVCPKIYPEYLERKYVVNIKFKLQTILPFGITFTLQIQCIWK